MAGAILASRILGLVRESVIAHQFSQGKLTDVYNAAFTLPDLLFFLIAGGALSGAFIPVFTEYLSTKREREAWRIFSVVASVMMIVVTIFIVVGEIFTPPLVALTSGFISTEGGIPVPGTIVVPASVHGLSLVAFLAQAGWHYMRHPELTPDKVAQTVALTRIVLPAQICFFLGGLMMGTLQAKGNPWGQALGPIIYNLFIILGGIFLAPFLGIAGLCWGAVIGAIVGNLGLQWVLVRRAGGKFERQWRSHLRHEGVLKVWRLMLPVILGLALPQVSTIIGKMFAGSLGDGPVSALMNANKLMQVPLGVFAQATAIALLPIMSAQAARMKEAQAEAEAATQQGQEEAVSVAKATARRELTNLRDSVNYGVRTILFLTVPSSGLMWILALPFVQLIFQGGKFHLEQALLAAEVLRWFAVGIFAWSAHSIITRGFYALQDSKTPIIVGTLVTVIFIPLNVPLRNLMGVSGLALATSIAATIHMLAMLYLLRIRLRGLDGTRLLGSVSKTVFASILACAACWLIYQPLYHHFLEGVDHGARLRAAVVLVVCLPISGAIYLGAALAMHMEEANIVRRLARKFARR